MGQARVGSGKFPLKSPSRFAKRIHGYRGGRPLTPREQSMDRKKHPPAALAWLVRGLGAALYCTGFYHRVAPPPS